MIVEDIESFPNAVATPRSQSDNDGSSVMPPDDEPPSMQGRAPELQPAGLVLGSLQTALPGAAAVENAATAVRASSSDATLCHSIAVPKVASPAAFRERDAPVHHRHQHHHRARSRDHHGDVQRHLSDNTHDHKSGYLQDAMHDHRSGSVHDRHHSRPRQLTHDGVHSDERHHASSPRITAWLKRDDLREELQIVTEKIGQEVKQLRSLIKEDLQEVVGNAAQNPPRLTRRTTNQFSQENTRNTVSGASKGFAQQARSKKSSVGSELADIEDTGENSVELPSKVMSRTASTESCSNTRPKRPPRATVDKSQATNPQVKRALTSSSLDIGAVPFQRFLPEKAHKKSFLQQVEQAYEHVITGSWNLGNSGEGVPGHQEETLGDYGKDGKEHRGENQDQLAALKAGLSNSPRSAATGKKGMTKAATFDQNQARVSAITGSTLGKRDTRSKGAAMRSTWNIVDPSSQSAEGSPKWERARTAPLEWDSAVPAGVGLWNNNSAAINELDTKQESNDHNDMMKILPAEDALQEDTWRDKSIIRGTQVSQRDGSPSDQIAADLENSGIIEAWVGNTVAMSSGRRYCRCRLRETCRRLIEDSLFDYLISGCIVLNAIFIGAQSDYQIRHLGKDPPFLFDAVETFFFIFFTIELTLRVYVYGLTFFYNTEWKWNWFDFVIVTLQMAEELMEIFSPDTNVDEMSGNVNFIRVIRILRLVRVLRLVRLLRFVSELRAMVCSILGSFRSLCWTLVLLILMIYVASVYLIQLIVDVARTSPETYENEASFQDYFGSIPRSVLTLFQAMTGGVDWNELVVPLMTHISPLMAIVFALYIAFAVLAMMNVITGVFVESALLTAKEDKEAELVIRVRGLFKRADEDNSGTISWQEFLSKCSDPEMVKYFKALDIDVSEARGLFQLLDTDCSGEVSAEEFVMGCVRLRGPAKAIDLATMMYFNKRVSARQREHMSWIEEELEEMFNLLEDTSSWIWSMVSKDDESNGGESNTLETNPGEEGDWATASCSSMAASSVGHQVSRPPGSSLVEGNGSVVTMTSSPSGRFDHRHSSNRRNRIEDPEDVMQYATWADLKNAGHRKASMEDAQREAALVAAVRAKGSRGHHSSIAFSTTTSVRSSSAIPRSSTAKLSTKKESIFSNKTTQSTMSLSGIQGMVGKVLSGRLVPKMSKEPRSSRSTK